MGDKFAIIETPCVSKKKERVIAIIYQEPRKVYADKKSLAFIHEIIESINEARKGRGSNYSIKFKLCDEYDMSIYETECNRIINGESFALEFPGVNEFSKWYKAYSLEVIKEIKADQELQDYVREINKKR